MALWIDSDSAETERGDAGFLVRVANENQGNAEHYQLRARPAHTNQSHAPRLRGWCGTTNNVAVFAEGLARIVRTTANGRAMLAHVPQAEEAAELERLGYPELVE